MAYRVLALILAAGLSLRSAALAKEQCPVGEVYFRSKHICVAKGTPVGRKIYHYRPPAAKAHEAAAVHRRPPAKAALPAKVPSPPPRVARTANSAAEIPLPPPSPMRSDAASPPARREAEAISGGANSPAAPEITHPSASPYGELVPVPPGE